MCLANSISFLNLSNIEINFSRLSFSLEWPKQGSTAALSSAEEDGGIVGQTC